MSGSNRGLSDDYGDLGCAFLSSSSPDAVYRVDLAVWSRVVVTVTGQDGFRPFAYLWSSCSPATEVTCDAGEDAARLDGDPMPPGAAYIIVDAVGGAITGDFVVDVEVTPYAQGDICEWPLDLNVSPARTVTGPVNQTQFYRVVNPNDINAWGISDRYDPADPPGQLWDACTSNVTFNTSAPLLDGLVVKAIPHLDPFEVTNAPVYFHIVHGGAGTCDDPRTLRVSTASDSGLDYADTGLIADYVQLKCSTTASTTKATVYDVEVVSGTTLSVHLRSMYPNYLTLAVALRDGSETCEGPPPDTTDQCFYEVPQQVAEFPVTPGFYWLYVYTTNDDEPFEIRLSTR